MNVYQTKTIRVVLEVLLLHVSTFLSSNFPMLINRVPNQSIVSFIHLNFTKNKLNYDLNDNQKLKIETAYN